jgi:multiple sugar transport system substrate-binding protein
MKKLLFGIIIEKWCKELGQIPVNIDTKINYAGKPALQVFADQIKFAKPRPKIPKYDMLEELINKEMEAALAGDKTCKEALDTAVKEIDRVVLSILRE